MKGRGNTTTFGDLDYNRVCGRCAARWLGPGPIDGDVHFEECRRCQLGRRKKDPEMPSFKTEKAHARAQGREWVPPSHRKPRPGFISVKTPLGYRWRRVPKEEAIAST